MSTNKNRGSASAQSTKRDRAASVFRWAALSAILTGCATTTVLPTALFLTPGDKPAAETATIQLTRSTDTPRTPRLYLVDVGPGIAHNGKYSPWMVEHCMDFEPDSIYLQVKKTTDTEVYRDPYTYDRDMATRAGLVDKDGKAQTGDFTRQDTNGKTTRVEITDVGPHGNAPGTKDAMIVGRVAAGESLKWQRPPGQMELIAYEQRSYGPSYAYSTNITVQSGRCYEVLFTGGGGRGLFKVTER